MAIQVLPPEVAAKIAAGEVVERPASALKELMENAIDAGASDIRAEIREGGKRLIRVVDDGCGIPADQVPLAFARHSTSKLHSLEDLEHILTLGFRGEALASIAAVSHLTMITCTREEGIGTLVRVEGGEIVRREKHGSPPGTTVTVENLFYNTPARRKFLRSDAAENALIADIVTSYALAYPEIRFTLLNNDRLVFQSTGTGQLGDVLLKAFGLESAQQMIEFREEDQGVSVWGYIAPPALHQAARKGLVFFVNRRWVQDRALSYAVEQAYHDLIPARRYPLAVVNIRLDPAEVDVNIHPTKREVRFRDSHRVFAAVQRAVRHALQERFAPPPVRSTPIPVAADAFMVPRSARPAAGLPKGVGQRALELQRTADALPGVMETQVGSRRLPMLRVVGQVAQTYIVAEGPGGVYLVDQHAAHERVVYERLLAERGGAQVATQTLLEPLVIELTPARAQMLDLHAQDLDALGFGIEPFGVNSFRVRHIPVAFAGGDVAGALNEMLDLAELDGVSWQDEALVTIVCHSAIRAGQTLSMPEMRDLIRQLEETSAPHSCPHGRPTMIHLSAAVLEREFGRR